MSIETGTRLGQYEIQDLIGQGAMGLVYRAYHVQLARTGAVKVMQGISPDQDSIARFRREAQAIAQMRHPNILNVFDFGEYQGTPYMIVEYVPGGSLSSRMKAGPIDTPTVLEYLDGIASGLDYAHSLGIVHRDVKPANVLLARDGTPIIADFGLVKLLQSKSMMSMTGMTTGTPAYMAPEQVTGSQVGPAADRYSLATMAYEMLTGSFPFEDDSVLEMLYAHVHREPALPSARRPELGAAVDAVLMRGLAKDPAARWPSCEAFVAALRSALESTPLPMVGKTMVMTPPKLASTAPMPVKRPKNPVVNPTVVVPLPVPAPAAPVPVAEVPGVAVPAATPAVPVTKKSHKRRNALVAAGIVLALLLVAFLGNAILHPKPTLALSSTTVFPGDHLVVTVQHLSPKQAGELQMLSQLHVFPFRADSNGNASVEVTVPTNIGLGDHIVRACWSSACPLQATLHVVALAAIVTSPTPTGSPTTGASPSPSANPTSYPTSNPASNPSPTPTSRPSPPAPPPPSPSPKPRPTPTPSPSVTLVSISSLGNTTVTFHYFYGGSATVAVCQGGTCRAAGTVSVASGSNVQVSFKTPTGILASPLGGSAYVSTNCCGQTGSAMVGL